MSRDTGALGVGDDDRVDEAGARVRGEGASAGASPTPPRGCALVTGASRGLGAAIAARLAADGWAVGVNYAHDDAGARAVAEGIAARGGSAAACRFDVTDEAAVAEGVRALAEQLGPVAALVNNATGPQPMMPVAQQTWDVHLDQLRFFVKAPLLLLQAVLPAMRAAGRGTVVNVGSEVTDLGNADFGHYVAAKAAMHGLTRSWARELGPEGITVNTVEPGWIPVERHADTPPPVLAAYADGLPLRRTGAPEDVAAAVSYLVSPAARFVTGQRLAVNGGGTMT